MQSTFSQLSEAEKKTRMKKVIAPLQMQIPRRLTVFQTNAVFELQVTNENKETVTWTIDMKKTGTVLKGSAKPKADVTLILSDATLVDLASGAVSPFGID